MASTDQPQPGSDPDPGQPPEEELDRTLARPTGGVPKAMPPAEPEEVDRTIASPSPAPTPPVVARPSGDPLVGTELGGCRIESLIGRGAMGAVYRARQLRLDRVVAVKVIRPDLITDRRALKRFEIEAKTVGRFNSPHVVMIHDVGHERSVHYIVMEFVPGKNLRDHVRGCAGERLALEEAIPFLRQACEGLKEAQRLGVLHRDIKPDNLMLGDRAILKIADFGIAKPGQDDFNMTMTAELMGTPLYMSPEQCRAAGDLDFRSDMFSLGATFYYLVTGEPPAKASSVYELIETKTKIEFLSVSKVLPEMGDDHPLSLIIEKMTALAREDRYESYDDILRDLALVAQGKEPLAERPRPRPRDTDARPVQRGGMAKIAVAVLLVAAVGVGAWQVFGNGGVIAGNGTNGGGSGPVIVTPAQLLAQIEGLRGDMRRDGPSAGLADKLQAIDGSDAVVAVAKTGLAADLERGNALRSRLTVLAADRPSPPRVPFSDVEEFFGKIDAATGGFADANPDLRQWLAGAHTQARGDNELRSGARAALLAEWASWQVDFTGAGGDPAQLAPLGGRLDRIEQGRTRLMQLFPDHATALGRDIAVTSLQTAREALAVPTMDVGAELRGAREEFRRSGPVATLRARVAALKTADQTLVGERDALLNDIGRASEIQGTLANLQAQGRPVAPAPQPPFTDIADYYERIDAVLKAVANGSDDLRTWADRARDDARAEAQLRPAAVGALGAAFLEWRVQRRAAAGATALRAAQGRLRELDTGRGRLIALYPDADTEVEAAMPQAAVDAAAGEVEAAVKEVGILEAIAVTARDLAAVNGLGAWVSAQDRLKTAVAGHVEAVAAHDAPAPKAALASLQTTLQRWESMLTDSSAVIGLLQRGDLSSARTRARALASADGAPGDVQRLVEAADACAGAFEGLQRTLDITAARELLTGARTSLTRLGSLGEPAAQRVTSLLNRLGELETAASAMAAIPGGRAGTAGGQEDVGAFFLGRREVSQAEYRTFLDEVQRLCDGAGATTWAGRLEVAGPRLGGVIPGADVLQRMLDRRSRLEEGDLPVDNLSWFEAEAFARWRELSLPKAAEWNLAALGPVGKERRFPWGDEWSLDPKDRNNNERKLAKVNEGGRSWRTRESGDIHHLGGNVAEWLAADPRGGRGLLAGGKFNDITRDAQDQASGKHREAALSEYRQGYGLRVMLRPETFFGSLWPR